MNPMIGEIASPYDFVFNSLKSDKKKSIILIGKLYLILFIKLFLYSKSNNRFLKFLN